jgi:hypothetical protein
MSSVPLLDAGQRPTLRESDWRYLLPRDGRGPLRHVAILGGLPRSADRLLAEGAAERVTMGVPTSPVDALVIHARASSSAMSSLGCLGPGGVLWLAVDRRRSPLQSPGRTMARLRRHGLVPVGLYWLKPSAERVEMAIPLDRRGPLQWYFEAQFMPTTPLRLFIRAVGRRLVRSSAGRALIRVSAPSYAIIAVNPSPGRELPRPGPAWLGSRDARAMLIAPGADGHNRVVLAMFEPGSKEPGTVAKIARTRVRSVHTQLEHAALLRLHGHVSPALAATLPRPLGLTELAGAAVGIETGAEGRLLPTINAAWRATQETLDGNLRRVAIWLERLHQETACRVPWQTAFDEHVGPVLDRYEALFAPHGADATLIRACRASRDRYADLDLPIVMQHDGLADWNIFLRPDGGTFVVDWEGAEPGPPLLDLQFYLWNWYLTATRAGPSEHEARFRALFADAVPRDAFVRLARRIDREYCRGIRLDRRLAATLRPLSFIRRATYHADGRQAAASTDELRRESPWAGLVGLVPPIVGGEVVE